MIQEALLIGQGILMLVAIGGMFVALGKILGQMTESNKVILKLSNVVEHINLRVNEHDTELALLRQRNELLDGMPVHLHRRKEDPTS